MSGDHKAPQKKRKKLSEQEARNKDLVSIIVNTRCARRGPTGPGGRSSYAVAISRLQLISTSVFVLVICCHSLGLGRGGSGG